MVTDPRQIRGLGSGFSQVNSVFHKNYTAGCVHGVRTRLTFFEENVLLSTFELTIQNTTIPQVRNLFSVIAVFISFPLARCCAPHPTPPPFFGEGKVPKKTKKKKIVGVGVVAARCIWMDVSARAWCAWAYSQRVGSDE